MSVYFAAAIILIENRGYFIHIINMSCGARGEDDDFESGDNRNLMSCGLKIKNTIIIYPLRIYNAIIFYENF